MNYQEPEPLTVGGITDEMVAAVMHRQEADFHRFGGTVMPEDRVRGLLRIALAVAPTVDGFVWCGHSGDVWDDEECAMCYEPCCGGEVCPGPHRTLLLGPGVES